MSGRPKSVPLLLEYIMRIRSLSHRQRKIIWTIVLLIIPILIISTSLMVKHLLIPENAAVLQNYVDVATIVLLCGAASWLIDQGLRIFLWSGTYIRLTGMPAPAVIRGAASAAVYLVTIVIILSVILKLDISTVLISTGLIAAILSVAMQSTITDFFSGISLQIDKPYHRGDWIEFEDGIIGEVVDITWRSTRIRSWNSSIYVVPNKKAASTTLHNYSQPNGTYGVWFNVLISGEVSPLRVRQLLLEGALRCKQVLDQPAPKVYFTDLGSQPFKYMVYVHFADYPGRFAAMDELFLEIYSQLSRAGISPAATAYEVGTYDLGSRRARLPKVSTPKVAETLRNLAMFEPLSDAEINELADDLRPKDVRVGEVIMEEGQKGESMFVIVTGIVALSRRVAGERREIERLGTGQCFGEMSLLTGAARYATAEAITNVRLIEIPKAGFAPIMVNNEELHEALARIVAARRARGEALKQAFYNEIPSGASSFRAAELKHLIGDFFRH